ncbi:hypothetical protein QNZ88_004960 [Vibrio parahaemolyticus]|nr:hypothetical protein [Vibrio parahaemolyticus]ELB2158033.1 hypothetical protein [Vibrio parahaemolyticus]
MNIKRYTRVLSPLLMCCFPLSSVAGYVSLNDIEVISVMGGYGHDGMFFESSKDIPNPADCPNNKNAKKTIAVVPANSVVSHVMSIALAAQTTKAKVDVHIYDDKCFEGWPVLRRIKIKQAP